MTLELAHTISKLVEFPDELMYGIASATEQICNPLLVPFTNFVNTNSMTSTTVDYVRAWIGAQMHPNSKRLPLMDPVPVLFGCVMYVVTLVVLYLLTRSLPKFTLKYFGMAHNFFLFALSFYMWFAILITAIGNGFTLWNNPIATNEDGWRMSKLVWVFYVSKLPEFIDTVIMVLKHNYRQISFLHLYHHGSIFVIWFIVVACGPGGDAYWSAMLNSGVHVVMYGYYFGTSIFSTGPIRKFLNSIKFFITYGQMTQFMLNVVQTIYLLLVVDREQIKYPAYLIQLLFWYMLTLLALFGNFLIKNKRKAQEEEESGNPSPRKSKKTQ